MKKIFLAAAALLSAVSVMAGTPASGKLGDILKNYFIPSTEFLVGEWHYCDNSYVFTKDEGDTPSKETADTNLRLMTVTPSNCVLTFLDYKTCTFRVGDKKFKLTYRLNPETREFKSGLAFFSIKGLLVQDGDRIDLIYTKSDLEMMMNFLCPASTHKYIKALSSAMDCTDGLTLCIQFQKQ